MTKRILIIIMMGLLLALLSACGSLPVSETDSGDDVADAPVEPTQQPPTAEPEVVVVTATPGPDDAAADSGDDTADSGDGGDAAEPTPVPDDSSGPAIEPVKSNSAWAATIETFDGIAYALVPPGCFEMGAEDQYSQFVEQPAHEFCIDYPFYIMVTEVANEDIEVSGFNISADPAWALDDAPRANVTWGEARAYCQSIGGRLPTEAEWEYAASGPSNLIWPSGDSFIPGFIIHAANSTSPIAVGSFPENASWVGALDLAGNVREWTSSLWKGYPYETNDGREGASSGDMVIRGGSYQQGRDATRTSFREFNNSGGISADIGWRCARDY